jgi:hypothetical protein
MRPEGCLGDELFPDIRWEKVAAGFKEVGMECLVDE